MDEPKVKIVVGLGERKFDLTLDEARELKGMLDDIFRSSEAVSIPAVYPYSPWYAYITSVDAPL